MSPDKLARMANQIGRFFAHKPHDQAVSGIRDHLLQFWDPRMRSEIIANLDNSGFYLDPLVREAVEGLRTGRPPSAAAQADREITDEFDHVP